MDTTTVQVIIEGGILVVLVYIGGVLQSIKRDTSEISKSTAGSKPTHGGGGGGN